MSRVGRYQVMLIVKDVNGILMRILALFNRRGYNVEKLTVGSCQIEGFSRMTMTVYSDEGILDQLQKQVSKLVDVVKIKVFPLENVIRRETMMIKLQATDENRAQMIQIAQIYRGQVLDVSPASLVIELTGSEEKLEGFIQIMKNYGILEIARTGVLGMSRGPEL